MSPAPAVSVVAWKRDPHGVYRRIVVGSIAAAPGMRVLMPWPLPGDFDPGELAEELAALAPDPWRCASGVLLWPSPDAGPVLHSWGARPAGGLATPLSEAIAHGWDASGLGPGVLSDLPLTARGRVIGWERPPASMFPPKVDADKAADEAAELLLSVAQELAELGRVTPATLARLALVRLDPGTLATGHGPPPDYH